ncbi:addiction module antidote protein, partial [Staphylococcus aureus]
MESLNASIEKSAPDAFLAALGEAAREHGMAKVAKISGLSRESLYRTLKTGSKLRFDTVQRVLNALGYRFVIQKS